MPLFTTAYAGSGKLDEALIADHLNGLLPEDLGFIFIPNTEIPPRKLVGLHRAVEWLQGQVGVEGTIPVPDLIAALVARRDGGVPFEGADEAEGGDDVALVMVHDPDNAADVALARAAHDAGIRVIDLVHAADDMLFEDEAPADETPPWEPEEVTEAAEAAEAIIEAAEVQDPAEAVQRATAAGVAAAQARADEAEQQKVEAVAAAIAPVGSDESVPFTAAVFDTITLGEVVKLLAKAIVHEMGIAGQAAIAAVDAPLASVTPIGTTGDNKADVAGQPPDTKVYYYNEEGASYRPARGILKKGETRVYLTKQDEADARAKGMLK